MFGAGLSGKGTDTQTVLKSLLAALLRGQMFGRAIIVPYMKSSNLRGRECVWVSRSSWEEEERGGVAR